MFDGLRRVLRDRQQREEYLVGLLCAVTVNFSMGAPEKAAVPTDFMPSERAKRPKQEDVAAGLRQLMRSIMEAPKNGRRYGPD